MAALIVYILLATLTSTHSVSFADEKSPPVTFQDPMKNGNSGPIMIAIQSGSFEMGDHDNVGKSYELPVHIVHIRKSFAISQFTVTFSEYDAFTRATHRKNVSQYKWQRGQYPVINVNQEDAQAYAQWLSDQTNRTYRLPSEAEWEYSARAGSQAQYPWGNDIGVDNAHCANCGDASVKNQTAPVGVYPANKWGLKDMIGNVWEITADCWNYDYINAPADGSAWRTGDCSRLVLRGGSWGDLSPDLRSSTRLRSYAGARTVNIGFRLVRQNPLLGNLPQ